MDLGLISSISIGLGTVVFAGLLWFTTRNSTIHNGLLELHKTYATPEMGVSIYNLYEFFRKECNRDSEVLKKKFIESLPGESNEKSFKDYDLDYSRRRVTHYYLHMADIYANNILCWKIKSRKLLFEFWNEQNLTIIPDIIIPVTEALAEYIAKKDNKDYKIDTIGIKRLKSLYDEANDFCNPWHHIDC